MELTKTQQMFLDALNKDKGDFDKTAKNLFEMIEERDELLKKKVLFRLDKSWAGDGNGENLAKAEINAIMEASIDLNDSDVSSDGAIVKNVGGDQCI